MGSRAAQMEVLGCVVRFFPTSHGRGCGALLAEKKGDQDFFSNIVHIQKGNRLKAFKRLRRLIQVIILFLLL